MTKLNANELLTKGIRQVLAAGITPGDISPNVKVNKNAKTRFGRCMATHGTYDFKIELNEKLLSANEDKAMNVMVHEILHTCKGCMNHGKLWTSYANRMKEMFGYDITRSYTHEALGLEPPKPKYIVRCESCSGEIFRHVRSKLITNVDDYSCRCGGSLKVIAC